LVCVTKYRRKLFDADAIDWLKAHFSKVCGQMSCNLLACDGEADHVHMLVEYPPKHSRNIQSDAQAGAAGYRASLLERRSVVAILLRCFDWRSHAGNRQEVRGTTTRLLLALKGGVSGARSRDEADSDQCGRTYRQGLWDGMGLIERTLNVSGS
jgi:hypothetical protein